MQFIVRAAALCIAVFHVQVALTADLVVPDQFPTIQEAVDQANSGDRVLVRSGTWIEQIEISEGQLVIESVDGAGETTLAGDGSAGFLLSVSGADTLVELRGFTVADGFGEAGSLGAGPGGGVLVEDATLIVNDSRFIDNAGILGGALSVIGGAVQVSGSHFDGNSALHGGAVYVESGILDVINSDFSDNVATNFGGAIAVFWSSEATLGDSLFLGNTANQFGGAIYTNHAEVDFRRLELTGNGQAEQGEHGGWTISTTGGGALYLADSNGRLQSSRILDNIAFAGTGLYLAGSGTLEVVNNLFAGNGAICDCGQGVVYANAASPVLINNTLADNGGLFGLFTTYNAFPVLRNSVVAGTGEAGQHFSPVAGNGLTEIDHSLLQGVPAAANIGDGVIVIEEFPALDPEADYTPLENSAAIDAGLNDAVPADVSVDLLDNPRFIDLTGDGPVVDIGAVERQAGEPPVEHDLIFHHGFRQAP